MASSPSSASAPRSDPALRASNPALRAAPPTSKARRWISAPAPFKRRRISSPKLLATQAPTKPVGASKVATPLCAPMKRNGSIQWRKLWGPTASLISCLTIPQVSSCMCPSIPFGREPPRPPSGAGEPAPPPRRTKPVPRGAGPSGVGDETGRAGRRGRSRGAGRRPGGTVAAGAPPRGPHRTRAAAPRNGSFGPSVAPRSGTPAGLRLARRRRRASLGGENGRTVIPPPEKPRHPKSPVMRRASPQAS